MSLNRRDIMKLFGAGAIIAPVVKGIPSNEVQAQLIHEPDFKLIEPEVIKPLHPYDALKASGPMDVTVTIRERATGSVIQMRCTAICTGAKPQIDVTSHDTAGAYRNFNPMIWDMDLRITGAVDWTERPRTHGGFHSDKL